MNEFKKDADGIYEKYYQTDFSSWDKQAEINYNNNEIRQKGRSEFFATAFDFMSANEIKGDYLEFGCHKARTFRMVLSEARRKNYEFMRFFAFDSFEGLPEVNGIDKLGVQFKKGDLTTSEEKFWELINKHGLFIDKIQTIKGFYEDSLNNELLLDLKHKDVKASLIYIDCDLYTSSKTVLNFIAQSNFLQDGTIIAFDDWDLYRANPHKGQRKAFEEFKEQISGGVEWQFEEWRKFNSASTSFIAQKID
uniref:TylF/MycF/NovP-related O-methyltransferase n=1 Tax=Campylobacter fetus TaxID=196 RepID=UPI003AF5ECD4